MSVELTVALVGHVVLGTATMVEPRPGSPPKLENADVTNYCCHESENVGDEKRGKIVFHIENREIEQIDIVCISLIGKALNPRNGTVRELGDILGSTLPCVVSRHQNRPAHYE